MLANFSFTRRYLLALFIIALLAVLAYTNLNKLIESQEDDGKWIYISDHQRLLTQQIALYAIYYRTKELEVKIQELEKAHILLIAHAQNSKKLQKIYFQKPYFLDKGIKNFLFHAKRFYENKDGQSLNYILKNSQTLLSNLEKIVNIYLEKSSQNTKTLKTFEFYILLLTLATLIFEALFIFMPANRSIIKKNRELIAQKDYSNSVIESSTDAIITIDKNSSIRTFNKEAKKVFGFDAPDTFDAKLLDFIFTEKYKQKHPIHASSFIETLKNSGESLELELQRFNKKTFPAKITFGKSVENKEIQNVIHVKDISKEKLKDKIVLQQAKFAALGEMIAIIAHQWRQPLSQLNFNYMYIKNKIEDVSLKEELTKNEEIISFMSDTITNFEQFYKKSEDTHFLPALSIEQALKIIQFSFQSQNITFTKKIQSTSTIYGSINVLSQVVLAILQNSVDIIKSRRTINPIIHIYLYQSDNYIIIQIEDNAGGIQVQPVQDIFKPFISKKSTSSTGIGLYMSRLIVEDKFQGNINVANKNNGAYFTITLPA